MATTYQCSNTASTTLATACKLLTATSTEGSNAGALIAKLLGWVAVNSAAQAVLLTGAAEPASATLAGWLLDDTSLENRTVLAGTWNFQVKIQSNSTPTMTPTMRVWKRTSGGVFTQIGTDVSFGSHVFVASTPQTLTANQSIGAIAFATGDKLYAELLTNVTGASASTTGSVTVFMNAATDATVQIPTAGLNVAAALAPSASITAGNAEKAAIAGALTASGAVAGANTGKATLAAGPTASTAITGTNTQTVALAAALAASAAVSVSTDTVAARLAGSLVASAVVAGASSAAATLAAPLTTSAAVAGTAAKVTTLALAAALSASTSVAAAAIAEGVALSGTVTASGAASGLIASVTQVEAVLAAFGAVTGEPLVVSPQPVEPPSGGPGHEEAMHRLRRKVRQEEEDLVLMYAMLDA